MYMHSKREIWKIKIEKSTKKERNSEVKSVWKKKHPMLCHLEDQQLSRPTRIMLFPTK